MKRLMFWFKNVLHAASCFRYLFINYRERPSVSMLWCVNMFVCVCYYPHFCPQRHQIIFTLMVDFVSWSVCLQKNSKTLKGGFVNTNRWNCWSSLRMGWQGNQKEHQPLTHSASHPPQTLNCKIESELSNSQKTKVSSLFQ